MGLLSKLVSLPLAPVYGVIWLAERLAERADAELSDEGSIHRALAELQVAHDLGEIDDETYAEVEESLLTRLEAAGPPPAEGVGW